jgi:hypothetical protein
MKQRRLLSLAIWLWLVVAFPKICFNQGSRARFSIVISTVETNVKSGAKLPLDVTLTNISDQEYRIGTSIGLRAERDFQIDVLDDQGHSAPRTAYGKKIDGQVGLYSGSIGSHLLKPGGSLMYHADLSKIFELTKPGSYTVQAQKNDYRNAVVVTSNSIILTVSQ